MTETKKVEPKNSGINWSEVDLDLKNLLIINEKNPKVNVIFIKSLGFRDKEIEGKVVKELAFEVLDMNDSNTKKELTFISKRAWIGLSKMEPLLGKKITIERTGYGFNTDYKFSEIE